MRVRTVIIIIGNFVPAAYHHIIFIRVYKLLNPATLEEKRKRNGAADKGLTLSARVAQPDIHKCMRNAHVSWTGFRYDTDFNKSAAVCLVYPHAALDLRSLS